MFCSYSRESNIQVGLGCDIPKCIKNSTYKITYRFTVELVLAQALEVWTLNTP